MKFRMFLCLLLSLFICSSSVYKAPPPKMLTIYEKAEKATGAPAKVLQAIAIVESDELDNAIGDEGKSRGRMQLNETFRAERVKKYGNYDPNDPEQSVKVSGFIFVENLQRLRSLDAAIAAHRQGVCGIRKHGITSWYVDRVKKAMEEL